jgi:magnesium chelatase family protein
MLARVQSYVLHGIDALPCEVELDADVRNAESRATVVGLPDIAVKESIERVKSALMNSGFNFPAGRVLINLAPAEIRKEGPLYDLPIAVGLLIAQGVISPVRVVTRQAAAAPALAARPRAPGASPAPSQARPAAPLHDAPNPADFLFAGELALDGRVRPIKGVIAMAALAKQRNYRGVIVPRENVAEAAVVTGVDAIGVSTLAEVVGLLTGHLELQPHAPVDVANLLHTAEAPIDFAEVRGQEAVKRALVVAAAGGHNIIPL